MYEDRFVVVVEQGGRVLREIGDTVTIPFGSDYGLRLKNLNSRRAVAKVTIDGEDVLGGNEVVVGPNAELALQGFMSADGRVRRKFRFTRKTAEVVEHRGDRLDDGMVRVEFRYEQPKPRVEETIHFHYDSYPWFRPWPHYPNTWYGNPTIWNTVIGSSATSKMSCCLADNSSGNVLRASCLADNSTPLADEGIPVKGGRTAQDFSSVHVGKLEEEARVIVIRLKGTTDKGGQVRQAVTTRQKLQCPTCGRKSKSSAEYCPGCGTALRE